MPDVSDEVREFLYSEVENIDRLRVLLLMYKEQVEWTVEMLSARLYIAPEKLNAEILILNDKGFVTPSGADSFRYAKRLSHDARVEEIARMDQEKPVTLINLVYDRRPPDRLKNFADAFKLKKKDS